MQRQFRAGAATLALALLAVSMAATAQPGSCASVYANAVTNIDIATRQFTEHENFFAEHCEANGSMRKHSDGTDFSVAYAGIQLGYKGTNADAQKRMQQFCKTHREERDRNDDVATYKKTVVVDALKSFNQCAALEAGGITMRPVLEAEGVIVTATFDSYKTGNPSLSAVVYDKDAASCTTNAGGVTQNLEDAKLPLSSEKPFQVSCTRKREPSKDGSTRLRRFALLLTIRDLPYSVVMPPDELLGYDLASSNKQEIAALSQSLASANATIKTNEEAMGVLQKANAAMRSELNKPVLRTTTFLRGTNLEVPCDKYPGQSLVQAHAPTKCRADETYEGVTGAPGTPWGYCGKTVFTVTCASKPKY